MASDFDLPTAAATLLVIAAALHLAIGATALASSGGPLAALLVLWGVSVLVGVTAAAFGMIPARPAYVGGLCFLAVSLVGYVDVNSLGISEALLGIEWQLPEASHSHGGHSHGTHSHGSEPGFFEQLAASHLALPSKLTEVAAAATLVVLLWRE